MRALVPLLLLACCLATGRGGAAEEDKVEPPDPIGVWRGELEQAGSGREALKLVLRIRHGREGQLTATLEGLAGGQPAVTVDNLVLVEDVLGFQVPQVEARFAGNFYGDSLRGTWTQGEDSRALFFYRD